MTWHRRPSTLTTSQKRHVLRQHYGICHVCGHGGATQVDHRVNVATWLREQRPGSPDALSNLAPIHGTPAGDDPCRTCGRSCHKDKTQSEAREGKRWRGPRRPAVEQHPGVLKGWGGSP